MQGLPLQVRQTEGAWEAGGTLRAYGARTLAGLQAALLPHVPPAGPTLPTQRTVAVRHSAEQQPCQQQEGEGRASHWGALDAGQGGQSRLDCCGDGCRMGYRVELSGGLSCYQGPAGSFSFASHYLTAVPGISVAQYQSKCMHAKDRGLCSAVCHLPSAHRCKSTFQLQR